MLVTNPHLTKLETSIRGIQASIQRIEKQMVELLKKATEKKKSNEKAVEVLSEDAMEEENGEEENMGIEKYEVVEKN